MTSDTGSGKGERERGVVTVYTDGACTGNPGPGGWGAVLVQPGRRKELSGGVRKTTNNRMEIQAAIEGLAALKRPCDVTVVSDSQYVANAIEKGWAKKWQRQGWWRTDKDKAINPDLWVRLLELCAKHKVRFQWVRGHAGHPENERCDELAVAAAKGATAVDEGYEKPPEHLYGPSLSGGRLL